MGQALPHIAEWIRDFGVDHDYLVYAAIVLLACVEGPWLALVCGVLVEIGDFPFLPVYTALMLGDLVGDAVWYTVGRRYGQRFVGRYGKYMNVTEEAVERMTRLFRRYKDSVLFLSKITNGFGFSLVTLMTAGMVKIPFVRYMLVNILGQLVWTGLLLGVGYYFSHLLVTVEGILARMSLAAGRRRADRHRISLLQVPAQPCRATRHLKRQQRTSTVQQPAVISIVVPTLNEEKVIGESLRSIEGAHDAPARRTHRL